MTDDELLTPRPSPANDGLKAELLDRTVRRVRFARRLRRAAGVAACLACFAAGAGTGFLRPAPEPPTVYVAVPVPPVAGAPGSPPEPPARVMSPAELELEAEK